MKCAHTATSKVLSGVEYDSVRLLNGNSQGPAIESKLERNRSSSLKKTMFFFLNGGRSACKELMEDAKCLGGQLRLIVRPSDTWMDESDWSQPDF